MREPWPWYSATRSAGGWFVKLNGDQHFLGKHPIGAAQPKKKGDKWNPPSEVLSAFYQLMSLRDTAAKSDYRLETIFALYLDHLGDENPDLAKKYEPVLGDFCDHEYKKRPIGKLLVNAEADSEHLESWARQFTSEQTQRTYINCVKTAMNWAAKKKSINLVQNPFAEVKPPKVVSRAVVITKVEHQALLKFFEDSYRDFLIALWFTGARPGEIAKVEKRHRERGLWRLDSTEHKTGRVTGKDRVIGIIGELTAIVDRLCRKYPTGPIFRNSFGEPWTTGASHMRFKKARAKKLIRPVVTPYAYRHAWATHALESGNLDVYEVAKAMGHQTTQMVMLHYDHSRLNPDHIRKIFERSGRATTS